MSERQPWGSLVQGAGHTGKAQLHVLDTLQVSLQQQKMLAHPLYSQTRQLWGCWGPFPLPR